MNLKELQLGDRVQYTSPYGGTDRAADGQLMVLDGGKHYWQGQVSKVTWKYVSITWTHSNGPVYGGPITKNAQETTGYFKRSQTDPTIELMF